jgi:ATP-GRASP peptide maturase of grasp-with-spasm system
MILIFSKEQGESTTEEIMDWLHFLECDFQRFNGHNLRTKPFKIALGENESFMLNNHDEMIHHENVSLILNRRWSDSPFLKGDERKINKDFFYSMKVHLLSEARRVHEYINHFFLQKAWVDKADLIQPNKIVILEKAKECGLNIPNTIVTNNKQDALAFLEQNNRICTKPIHEVSQFYNYKSKKIYLMDTKEVKREDLQSVSDIFFPSLFQKLVEKKFDLRVFYLDEKFYPMAIFSQRRKKSVLDFRNYNFSDPDRTIPFKLPDDVESCLLKLVNELGYKHCSIDLLKDIDNEYYFLEINPVGQFGMVSKPCNYNLEMKLAIFLKKEYEKK